MRRVRERGEDRSGEEKGSEREKRERVRSFVSSLFTCRKAKEFESAEREKELEIKGKQRVTEME